MTTQAPRSNTARQAAADRDAGLLLWSMLIGPPGIALAFGYFTYRKLFGRYNAG